MPSNEPDRPNGASEGSRPEKLVEVFLDAEGGVAFVHDDDAYELLAPLFQDVDSRRASHVEPAPGGGWTVDMSPVVSSLEPVVIGFHTRRDDALEHERQWLSDHLAKRNPDGKADQLH